MAELSLEDSQREELLASGMLGLLKPAVEQVDQRIGEVSGHASLAGRLSWKRLAREISVIQRNSQAELREKIDFLAEELRRLSEKQKVPVDLDTYIKKLANSRKRISLVNDILQNVQDRLEKLHKNVARETARQRAAIEACQ